MTQYIAPIQARHRHLADDHFQERRKCREYTKLVLVEPEPSRCREVATLHDPRRNENLWVFLMDHLKASGTFKIAYNFG